MADKTITFLLEKIHRLEADYEEMSAKVDLLIHSVNNLYDEVYKDKNCCNCDNASEEEEEEEGMEEEPVAAEDERAEDKIESVADVILAIAEELERRKKL